MPTTNKAVWRPYTSMHNPPDFLTVVDTKGSRLKLADGRWLIDAVGSWWTSLHGYRPQPIIDAITLQAATVPHVMLGGCIHPVTQILAERLGDKMPGNLQHVFFADSGSVAVEVAMKMAIQYHHNRGIKTRKNFISFLGGYHGDTFGAMSLCDPEEGMHTLFQGAITPQHVQAIPTTDEDFDALDRFMQQHSDTLAGLFIEPRLQGAGGMLVHSADQLRRLHALCQKNEILFIADELFTGFGRTGTLWGCDSAGITPDIMCIGKALTGGVISLGATVATSKVFSAFDSDDPGHALMHGPTYMGNPLACAAAIANLDLLEENNWQANVAHTETSLKKGLTPLESLPAVKEVRVLGAMGAIELYHPPKCWDETKAFFIKKGVWLRPFGNIIYTVPAYNIEEKDLEQITTTMGEAIEISA